MDRYVISIQSPRVALEVLVWDRQDRKVLFSTAYKKLSIDDQQAAKKRCQEFLDKLLQEEKE